MKHEIGLSGMLIYEQPPESDVPLRYLDQQWKPLEEFTALLFFTLILF